MARIPRVVQPRNRLRTTKEPDMDMTPSLLTAEIRTITGLLFDHASGRSSRSRDLRRDADRHNEVENTRIDAAYVDLLRSQLKALKELQSLEDQTEEPVVSNVKPAVVWRDGHMVSFMDVVTLRQRVAIRHSGMWSVSGKGTVLSDEP